MTGTVGPSFEWNLLNYGRILNNVRLQDAKFRELVAAYQSTVLNAAQETENGVVTFLKAQQRTAYQEESVKYAENAVKITLAQYENGTIDLTRVTQLELLLVQEQDTLALAKGEIPTGLIQIFKGLGGGWQIRVNGCETTPPPGQLAVLRPVDGVVPAVLVAPGAARPQVVPAAAQPATTGNRALLGRPSVY